jgi:hypothetical protein
VQENSSATLYVANYLQYTGLLYREGLGFLHVDLRIEVGESSVQLVSRIRDLGNNWLQETHKLRPFAAGYSRWRPGSIPVLVIWDLWWTKSGTGASLLRVLRFPLPILIPPTAPY